MAREFTAKIPTTDKYAQLDWSQKCINQKNSYKQESKILKKGCKELLPSKEASGDVLVSSVGHETKHKDRKVRKTLVMWKAG